MKNNRGFTLVELIAVVAILLVLGFMVTPKVLDIIDENRIKAYQEIEKRLEEAAAKYLVENYVSSNTEIVTITKEQLIEGKYIEEIYDLKDNSICDGYVYAYNLNSIAEFDIILTCSSYQSKGIIATSYINGLYKSESALHNGLTNPKIIYEDKEYDTGIRYSGSLAEVKNKVYYNCEDKDSNGVGYGSKEYDYVNSCETWRIIGVFDVSKTIGGTTEKRLKIINTNSTFRASWDSSDSSINGGSGINQWGSSTYKDANDVEQFYAGADLMQLLNGYYIEKNNDDILSASKKECKYNTAIGQSGFSKTCDTTDTPLSSFKMKPLTSTALTMIDNAVWYTYGTQIEVASKAYLEERGITKRYTGCKDIEETTTTKCTGDNVTRNNKWTGLVGLISLSDILYTNGWLNPDSIYSLWSITPRNGLYNSMVWLCNSSGGGSFGDAYNGARIWPTTYLKSNIRIIGGNGDTKPYILGI